MDIQKKRDFLINVAYWAIVVAGAYLAMEYVLPISIPCILGILVAWMVVGLSRKLRCTNRVFRICLSLLIYGVIALLVV